MLLCVPSIALCKCNCNCNALRGKATSLCHYMGTLHGGVVNYAVTALHVQCTEHQDHGCNGVQPSMTLGVDTNSAMPLPFLCASCHGDHQEGPTWMSGHTRNLAGMGHTCSLSRSMFRGASKISRYSSRVGASCAVV
jgi:hypothetical protein